jgi:hypothetical protein
MPDRGPIPSPADRARRGATAAAIGDAAGIAGLWSALEVQITGSGLALGVTSISEISGVAAVGIFGGSLALAAAPAIALGLGVAMFSSDESLLVDVAKGVDAVSSFASASTMALVALTAPLMGLLPTRGFEDQFALQKLGGQIGDLGIGIASPGDFGDKLYSAVSFAAGVPGAATTLQQLQTYLNESTPSSGLQPTNSTAAAPGVAGQPTNNANGIPGNGGPYLYPGMGELGDSFFWTEGDSYNPSGTSGMTFSLQPGYDNFGSGSGISGSSGNDTGSGSGSGSSPTDCVHDCPTDCTSDCQTDCVSDCVHDCVHDCQCSDCQCSDCQCSDCADC